MDNGIEVNHTIVLSKSDYGTQALCIRPHFECGVCPKIINGSRSVCSVTLRQIEINYSDAGCKCLITPVVSV
jgi:hypothetical protein